MNTRSESPSREKVYFVVSERHLKKAWPELLENPRPFPADDCPERILSGRDCWCIQTWARLCAAECPFEPILTTKAVPNAVCVFHYDDAVPALGVHRCFAVVAQADRPLPALADLVITQNGLNGESTRFRHIPHWPQPGLVPRNPERGTRLEHIAYFGSNQYEPRFVQAPAFQEALRQRGICFVNRFQGTWNDYRDVDAVLAVRNCPPVVLATKPASKLVNAWTAGVPALLGPEPAYRELWTSPLDFLETPTEESVLEALDRLKANPALHADMIAQGLRRAGDFRADRLAARWIETLGDALDRNRQSSRKAALRAALYYWNKAKGRIAKKGSGWRD